MRSIFFLSLITLSSACYAQDWKVIAETENCQDQVQIMGKEGEKYVLAVHGDKKEKLFSKDGSSFKKDMEKTSFYANKNDQYAFTQPSVVEANTPKLDMVKNGKKQHCRMMVK